MNQSTWRHPRRWPRPGARAVVLAALVLAAAPPPLELPGWLGGPPHLILPTVALGVLGVGLVAAWVAQASVPLALLLTWATVRTLVWGPTPRALWCLIVVIGMVALYRIVADLPVRADRSIAGVILAIAGLQLVLGVLDVTTGNPLIVIKSPELQGFPFGLLAHPNHFALYVALAFPLAVALLVRKPWWRLGVFTAWAVLALALVGRSHSRVGILALAPTLLWLVMPALARLTKRERWVGLGWVVILGALSLLAWAVNPRQLWDLGGRLGAWTVMAVDLSGASWWRWVIGLGLGGWAQWALSPTGRLRFYGVPELSIWPQNAASGWWTEAHNEPLQLLAELGLIGLALGLWAAWQAIRDIGRAFRSGPDEAMVHGEVRAGHTVWYDAPRPIGSEVRRREQAWALVVLIGLLASPLTVVFHHAALASVVTVAAARLRGVNA